MAKNKKTKSEWTTLHLPLDLILKCYAACIEQRVTFDQFIKQAIDHAYEKHFSEDKNEKMDRSV